MPLFWQRRHFFSWVESATEFLECDGEAARRVCVCARSTGAFMRQWVKPRGERTAWHTDTRDRGNSIPTGRLPGSPFVCVYGEYVYVWEGEWSFEVATPCTCVQPVIQHQAVTHETHTGIKCALLGRPTSQVTRASNSQSQSTVIRYASAKEQAWKAVLSSRRSRTHSAFQSAERAGKNMRGVFLSDTHCDPEVFFFFFSFSLLWKECVWAKI